MATLLHCTGYPLADMYDDYNGELSPADIETIGLDAAIADLPDLLRQGDVGDWPVAAAGWVEAWDGQKTEWPGTHTSEIWKNTLGNLEVVTSLYW